VSLLVQDQESTASQVGGVLDSKDQGSKYRDRPRDLWT